MSDVWKSKDMGLQLKVKLAKAMIWIFVLYGCESWTLSDVWKSKDIGSKLKVKLAKGMIWIVVILDCESWTLERQRRRQLRFLSCGFGEEL